MIVSSTLHRSRAPFVVLAFLFSVLYGCSDIDPIEADLLQFGAKVEVSAGSFTTISLDIRNQSSAEFPGDEDFAGVMELRDAEDVLLVRMERGSMPELSAGSRAFPMSWRGFLPPGDYDVRWGAPSHGYTRVAFTLEEQGGQIYLRSEQVVSSLVGPAANFPIPDDFGSLQTLVAQSETHFVDTVNEEPLQPERITLQFASFPRGTRQATPAMRGYLLTLSAGEHEHIYHLVTGRGRFIYIGPAPSGDPLVTVERVELRSDGILRASGDADGLPDGACIHTLLYQRETPELWWPSDACAAVQSNQWEIAAPLAVPVLEQGAYLRAWWPMDPRFSDSMPASQ